MTVDSLWSPSRGRCVSVERVPMWDGTRRANSVHIFIPGLIRRTFWVLCHLRFWISDQHKQPKPHNEEGPEESSVLMNCTRTHTCTCKYKDIYSHHPKFTGGFPISVRLETLDTYGGMQNKTKISSSPCRNVYINSEKPTSLIGPDRSDRVIVVFPGILFVRPRGRSLFLYTVLFIFLLRLGVRFLTAVGDLLLF